MGIIQSIKTAIEQKSKIPFVEFMHLALYTPGEGYYSSALPKLGKEGDFITAPELSPLFGKTLANQCQQVLTTLTSPSIFEFGAGNGTLCIDILKQLESMHALPEFYYILEVSAHLRHQQEKQIKQEIPHLLPKVQWLSTWPDKPFDGIVLANEVLDAMPVHRFMNTDQGILESYISKKEDNLIETFKPTENETLKNHIKTHLPDLPKPYLSEVNLFINNWMQQCHTMLRQGVVILLDYGFPRHEYYHPDRKLGTIMCHYQHQSHTNPLIHIGEQDITAHVDFTHVAEAAHDAGFDVLGYTDQASFLLSNGLLDFIAELDSDKAQFNARQAIKQLTQPGEMGELFKVIALGKSYDEMLNGFQLFDKRASL